MMWYQVSRYECYCMILVMQLEISMVNTWKEKFSTWVVSMFNESWAICMLIMS